MELPHNCLNTIDQLQKTQLQKTQMTIENPIIPSFALRRSRNAKLEKLMNLKNKTVKKADTA
jgi:hypothetical protein